VAFVIEATKVVADSATDFKKGNCGDLRDGRDVSVTGTVQADHTMKAMQIEINKTDNDDN
jgi:hypothetical protein